MYIALRVSRPRRSGIKIKTDFVHGADVVSTVGGFHSGSKRTVVGAVEDTHSSVAAVAAADEFVDASVVVGDVGFFVSSTHEHVMQSFVMSSV
jgi:hypothetical protein